MFRREISRKAIWDFFDSIGPEATNRRRKRTKIRPLAVYFRTQANTGRSCSNRQSARLQARKEAAERRALVCGAAANEQSLDPPMRAVQRVHSYHTGLIAALGDRARQQRHAHIGRHTADDAVERAEFEAGGRRPAEFAHQLLEPLAIGASRAKDEDRRA